MTNTKIAIKSYSGLKIIDYNDIIYCLGDGQYTWIYLKNGENLVSAKILRNFVEYLPEAYFLRVHKSSLINISYIKIYDERNGGNIVMENGQCFPVAKRRKKEIRSRIEEAASIV